MEKALTVEKCLPSARMASGACCGAVCSSEDGKIDIDGRMLNVGGFCVAVRIPSHHCVPISPFDHCSICYENSSKNVLLALLCQEKSVQYNDNMEMKENEQRRRRKTRPARTKRRHQMNRNA